jgi:type IV pilus assembly protein PilE
MNGSNDYGRIAAPCRTARARMNGVTLLELMAVVVIIGTLAAIAIPSYRQYSMRAQRTEAKSALLQLAANQERFYLLNRRYGTLAELGAPPFNFPTQSENGVYTLAVAPAAGGLAQGYTATAAPKAGGGTNGVDMTADAGACGTFTLTSQGIRSSAPKTDCW